LAYNKDLGADLMKFKNITTRMTMLFGMLMFVVCLGLGVLAYLSANDALKASIDENLLEIAQADAKVVGEKIRTQLNALEALAESPWIVSDELTVDEKIELLQNEVKRSGHINMLIADVNGEGKNTDGINVSVREREYFVKALAGESNVADPIPNKMDQSIVIIFAVPIKDGNNVVGVLAAIRDGNDLSNFTNEMMFNEREVFMINNQGTTVANPDRNRVLEAYNIFEEYKANPDLEQIYVLQKKMAEGEKCVGQYTFNGVTKYMGYHPVEGTTWSLGVTAPKSVVMAKVDELTTRMIVLDVFFLLVGIGLTFLIARNISRPIKETTQYLNVIATGDFTEEISEKLLAMEDEIGSLARSLDKMKSSIRKMVREVVDQSADVRQMLNTINNNIYSLNESIEEISATTEQLSAGTEETAASSEEMNATSLEIEKALESVASKAQEGATAVTNVSMMSEEMKQKAIASKEEALEIYGRTKANLQRAIEQSKAVNQIDELSNAILEITSQTNLLALNAAIEAARAGEAGRGFAVVAEEIRKLAEGSKASVSRIQEVTHEVLAVVNALSSSSMELEEFIDKKVLNDYEGLVQTGESYSKNSMMIHDIVTGFSSTSEELLASMQNMVQAITQITTAANEEAVGATNIAQEIEAIVRKAENVVNLASKANEKSEALIELVKHFKV